MIDKETLGTRLDLLGTVNETPKLLSSTTIGVLWTAMSPAFSFGLAAGLMAPGTLWLATFRSDRGVEGDVLNGK